MTPDAIIFDFDGVLIESEWDGNRHMSAWLTAAGHPIDIAGSVNRFTGLSGPGFTAALEAFVGGPVPAGFAEARRIENRRVLDEGLDEVAGAVAFVRALPAELPIAVASSSTTGWICRHLEHLGLAERFGDHLYSGQEHVERGKPEPDLYLHAAASLGVPIERCAVIEESEVGVTGAAASGAFVVGLCAGRHCAVGHGDRLLAKGADAVAADFDEVARLLDLPAIPDLIRDPASSSAPE